MMLVIAVTHAHDNWNCKLNWMIWERTHVFSSQRSFYRALNKLDDLADDILFRISIKKFEQIFSLCKFDFSRYIIFEVFSPVLFVYFTLFSSSFFFAKQRRQQNRMIPLFTCCVLQRVSERRNLSWESLKSIFFTNSIIEAQHQVLSIFVD